MRDDTRVVVGIEHPGVWLDFSGHLVGASLGGHPGAKIDELPDAAPRHPPHRSLQESSVRPGRISYFGHELHDSAHRIPINLKIRGAA